MKLLFVVLGNLVLESVFGEDIGPGKDGNGEFYLCRGKSKLSKSIFT